LEFETHYNHKIRQLLYNFPADFVDQHGVPFWSGAKRPPTPIEFDVNNQLHLDFVVFASYLRAYTYGLIESELKPIDLEETIEHIKKFVVTVKPPTFVPQKVKIPTQTDGSDANQSSASLPEENEEEIIEQIIQALPKPQDLGEWRVCFVMTINLEGLASNALQQARSVTFEKDDDKNFHIDFITSASNLRASAYLIPTADRLKSKLIAGKVFFFFFFFIKNIFFFFFFSFIILTRYLDRSCYRDNDGCCYRFCATRVLQASPVIGKAHRTIPKQFH